MKTIVKRISHFFYSLGRQYERERIRKEFNLPESASYGDISLDGNVTVGAHTYINDYSRVDSGKNSKVVIGKYCAIGRYVHITSKTHDLAQPTQDENHPINKVKEADVVIGDYVWIGDKVTVLPGVTIGDHAVLAAHALVTKNVKPFEIVGGVPARHIRFNTVHDRFPKS